MGDYSKLTYIIYFQMKISWPFFNNGHAMTFDKVITVVASTEANCRLADVSIWRSAFVNHIRMTQRSMKSQKFMARDQIYVAVG